MSSCPSVPPEPGGWCLGAGQELDCREVLLAEEHEALNSWSQVQASYFFCFGFGR